jgi:hypothetical protein
MDRRMLEQWLCGDHAPPPPPAMVAAALGLPVGKMADTTFLRTAARVRSMRFTLAVLHDVFPVDAEVLSWLEEPRSDLGGLSAREALLHGRIELVEQLAIRTWNECTTARAA